MQQPFALRTQGLAARGEDVNIWCAAEQLLREHRGAAYDTLTVIQHDQYLFAPEEADECRERLVSAAANLELRRDGLQR
jgi:hypothetical protein